MATSPQYAATMKVAFGTVLTANTAKDGTGTVVTVATGGTNGSLINKIEVRALGTNVATVMRFFVNNGLTNATATNNSLAYEATIAATTLSEVAALADNIIDVTRGSTTEPVIPFLPTGYKINITIGTTVAAGLAVTVFYSDL